MKIIPNRGAWIHTHSESETEILEHLYMIHEDHLPSCIPANVVMLCILIHLLHTMIQHLVVEKLAEESNRQEVTV